MQRAGRRLLGWMEGARWRLGTVVVGLLLAIGIMDFLAGFQLGFSLFYLMPVFLAAWTGGWRLGTVLALICALMWSSVEVAAGRIYSPGWVLYWNAAMRLGTLLAFAYLAAALRGRLDAEQASARTDTLTGLANRRHFLETAAQELARVERRARPLSIAYLDVDNLKQVNDRLGHAAGDAALRLVARLLRENLRPMDLPARIGGDEFAVLLPETDGAQAQRVIDRLLHNTRRAAHGRGVHIGLSVGVVTADDATADLDELLRLADRAMYAAKDAGKNRVYVQPGAGASGSS